MYEIKYSHTALKDISKIKEANLEQKTKELINIIRENPYQNPPRYEKLSGEFLGLYSRRINIQHRLIYQVFENEKIIKILSIWTHYERI